MTQIQASPARATAGPGIWRSEDGHNIETFANSVSQKHGKNIYNPEIQDTIEAVINSSSDGLRKLSLDIHGELQIWSAWQKVLIDDVRRSSRAQL